MPGWKMPFYLAASLLLFLTQGLGMNLLTANIYQLQGSFSATTAEVSWLSAAYMAPYASLSIALFKIRTQFGLRPFAELSIVCFVIAALLNLLVTDLHSAIVVRAISGIAAAPISTLGFLYMLEAFPPERKLSTGISLALMCTLFAAPVARIISPSLLEFGGYHALYTLEMGLALIVFAIIYTMPLTPPPRAIVIQRLDILSYLLLASRLRLSRRRADARTPLLVVRGALDRRPPCRGCRLPRACPRHRTAARQPDARFSLGAVGPQSADGRCAPAVPLHLVGTILDGGQFLPAAWPAQRPDDHALRDHSARLGDRRLVLRAADDDALRQHRASYFPGPDCCGRLSRQPIDQPDTAGADVFQPGAGCGRRRNVSATGHVEWLQGRNGPWHAVHRQFPGDLPVYPEHRFAVCVGHARHLRHHPREIPFERPGRAHPAAGSAGGAARIATLGVLWQGHHRQDAAECRGACAVVPTGDARSLYPRL
jgi:hypothetical protein